MARSYEIVEVKAWVREGFSPRAAHVVEHEGFDLVVQGYRVKEDGRVLFSAYPPKTFAECEAIIAERSAR